jgi:hypothetical protein
LRPDNERRAGAQRHGQRATNGRNMPSSDQMRGMQLPLPNRGSKRTSPTLSATERRPTRRRGTSCRNVVCVRLRHAQAVNEISCFVAKHCAVCRARSAQNRLRRTTDRVPGLCVWRSGGRNHDDEEFSRRDFAGT